MQPDSPDAGPQHEPTVLDWFRSLLRGRPIPIPEKQPEPAAPPKPARLRGPEPRVVRERVPFRPRAVHLRLPVALLLALMAQYSLERRSGSIWISIGLYLLAAGIVGWAAWSEDAPDERPGPATGAQPKEGYRLGFLVAAAGFSLLTFLASSDNQFRMVTIVFWVAALTSVFLGLWQGDLSPRRAWRRLADWLRHPSLNLRLDSWALLVLLAFAVSAFFRFVRLADVPHEMVSDQAEKLLDVLDVLRGRYSIFFPRNTGREALQFYLAAATARILGTGVSFLTLKIGTALAGFLTLPYIYLLGRELGGRKAGLAALLLAGVGYWPNAISRVGLRFPLFPLFVAPAMFYLARGIRLRRRNDFLLCGLAIGIGLHGYSPARAIPVLVAVGLGLYLLHRSARGHRWASIGWLAATVAVALVVILPLARVAVDMPEQVLSRTLTRISGLEQPLPGPAWQIFFSNVWNGLRMFAWDNGSVWVIGIPGRPALDWVTGAFFHLGAVIALIRYIRRRNWLDLFILISIPILQLPSTLSLAFPGENPATNRAGGALVPAFVLAGLALAALPQWARSVWGNRGRVAWTLTAAGLSLVAIASNYRLVFVEWADLTLRSAWNTSQMGEVVRGFAGSIGSYDTAHVVAYPYWVDTRLVAINAGNPGWDYAVEANALGNLATETRAQLFLINTQDTAAVETLRSLFPDGRLSLRVSPLEGKNFLVFLVPAVADLNLSATPTPEP